MIALSFFEQRGGKSEHPKFAESTHVLSQTDTESS